MKLPVDLEMERTVLGYAMKDESYMDQIRTLVETSEMFSLDIHRTIWGRIVGLYDASRPVDIVTVISELDMHSELQMVGGRNFVAGLLIGLYDVAKPRMDEYCGKLKVALLRRRMIAVGQHIANSAGDELSSVDELMEMLGKSVADITQSAAGSNKPVSTHEMIEEIGISTLMSGSRDRGIKLPWERLSKALSGLSAGQMVVLMAATSRGKTSMALQVATCAAGEGHTPVIWTMEMNPRSLFQRMMTQLSGVYCGKGLMTFDERSVINLAAATLNERPIYFDSKSRNVGSFVAGLRQVRSKTRLGLAIVDYLQLIRGSGRNRAQEVSDNSRALKLAAMDLGIPFLVLCQVDRSSVKGDGKIGLHSGKESGDIENDADVVLWIEGGELSRDQETTVSLHVGKQREGPAGFSIPMLFRPTSQTFMEVSD